MEEPQDTTFITIDPKSYDKPCNLSEPVQVAEMSWYTAEPLLTFGPENVRHAAGKSIKNSTETVVTHFAAHMDMTDGMDAFTPSDLNRTPCEALTLWMATSATGAKPTVSEVTGDAKFVTDSELLSKIAATPYAGAGGPEWVVGAFHVDNTVFIFEHRESDDRSTEQLQEEFQREKFRRTLTKEGYDKEQSLDCNDSYHRLLRAEIGEPNSTFRIFYSAPISAVDRKGNAVDMRVESDKKHDKAWYTKALRWYAEGRLAGVKQIDVGNIVNGQLVGMAQVPIEWIAEEAKKTRNWRANVACTFLYEVLKKLRERVLALEDGQVISASFKRHTLQVEFARNRDLDDFVPVSDDFWKRFAVPEDDWYP